MPVVQIGLWTGRSKEVKAVLIENVTKAVCDSIGCPPESVTIVLEDIPKENWGQGGKQG